MKKIKAFFVFLLVFNIAKSQQLKTVEIIADGRVEWQFLLPLEDKGLVLFYKNEMTKGSIIRYDKDLNQIWQSEFFIDAERSPRAFTSTKDKLSLMFSENNGAYYQIYEVTLSDGKINDFGFEIKEFFQDQDYVLLNNGVVLGGSNEKGMALYKYQNEDAIGEILEKDLKGLVSVQSFQLNEETNQIEAVFSLQKTIEQTSKQKKAKAKPVVISSEIVLVKMDSNGEIIEKVIILPENGNNPLNAKVLRINNNEFALSGTYRNPSGKQGVYFAKIKDSKKEFIKFYDFETITKNSELTSAQLKILIDEFKYSLHDIENKENQFVIAGEFYRPEFKTVTEYVNNQNGYNDPYSGGGNFGGGGFGRGYNDPFYNNNRQNTRSKHVFNGYRYATGLVYSFDDKGNLISNDLVGIDKLSREVSESFAFSSNNELALCKNGKVIVTRLNDPGIQQNYEIKSEESNTKNKIIKPQYSSVKHWFENIFIAIGSKNEVEMQLISNDDLPVEKNLFGKKKVRKPTQTYKVKRTIYLTKIAS